MRNNSTSWNSKSGMCFFDLLPCSFGNVDKISEAGGAFPRFVVLRKDEREDGREFRGSGIVAEIVVPNANHVGQQAKANERVFLVLMLKEDVEKGGLAVDFRCEEEVARGGGKLGVDETAADEGQRVPDDAAGKFARDIGFQKGASVVGVREG
jgi:hypothetical protein